MPGSYRGPEQTFFTGDVRREAIARLRAYYGAIGRAADEIAEYPEKQQFLKGHLRGLLQGLQPRRRRPPRRGLHPQREVVDFIIRGADHLLQKHFGRSLADDNVQILDPATGTGTFVTSLIDYLAETAPDARLEHKYRNEIHANEVAILPYYIANLNIEYSYRRSARAATCLSPTSASWTRSTIWTGSRPGPPAAQSPGRAPSTSAASPRRTGSASRSRTKSPSA